MDSTIRCKFIEKIANRLNPVLNDELDVLNIAARQNFATRLIVSVFQANESCSRLMNVNWSNALLDGLQRDRAIDRVVDHVGRRACNVRVRTTLALCNML